MEKGQSLRLYKGAAAEEYAKLVAALEDLTYCRKCLLRIEELAQQKESDSLLLEALWDASTIGFFRSFENPQGLKREILKELPEGAEEAFSFFKNYRNQHIAHRSNPMDQVKVGIVLSDPSQEVKSVEGVGHLLMKEASFTDPEFVKSLSDLVLALGKKIKEKIKGASKNILEDAKRESIEKLYKLPELRVVVPFSNYLRHTKPNSS